MVKPISGGSLREAELPVPGVAWRAPAARSESPFVQGLRRLRRSTTARQSDSRIAIWRTAGVSSSESSTKMISLLAPGTAEQMLVSNGRTFSASFRVGMTKESEIECSSTTSVLPPTDVRTTG